MPKGVYIRTKPNSFLGKHHTEESCKKISQSRRGKYTGTDNHMFGKHPSEETCEKMRKAKIGKISNRLGTHHTKDTIDKIKKSKIGKNNPHFGKQRPACVCKKISDSMSGEHCYLWEGGKSFLPYCNKFNDNRKKAVRDFFNNLCICTGEPSYNKALCVHHIDHDKEQGCNGKSFNLVPMCIEHHNKEQRNQEEYKVYINKTLREGFKWGIWNEEEYIEKVMY